MKTISFDTVKVGDTFISKGVAGTKAIMRTITNIHEREIEGEARYINKPNRPNKRNRYESYAEFNDGVQLIIGKVIN